MQRLLDNGADEKASKKKSGEYAFITVTVLDTDHSVLLRLTYYALELQEKKRIVEDILVETRKDEIDLIRSVRLIFQDRTLGEDYRSCKQEGLEQASHVLCRFENQSVADMEAQTRDRGSKNCRTQPRRSLQETRPGDSLAQYSKLLFIYL